MTELFEMRRFAQLTRAHLIEQRRDYGWFILAVCVGYLVLAFIRFWLELNLSRSFLSWQYASLSSTYFIGLFLVGLIFTGRMFRHLSEHGAALITFMRPASIFEKCLLAILLTTVLFPLAYTLLFELINYPLVQLAKSLYVAPRVCPTCAPHSPADFEMFIPLLPHSATSPPAFSPVPGSAGQIFMYLVLITLQSFIVGGTIYFNRSPLLKTFFILVLLFILISSFGIAPQLGVFATPSTTVETSPLTPVEIFMSILIWVGMPILGWSSVFFHMKEREVTG